MDYQLLKVFVDDIMVRLRTHMALANAHHEPYTDAQVDAKILTHTNIADAHHTKYTDAEAINATKNQKSAFYAYQLKEQSIPTTNWYLVEYNLEIADIANDYNNSTYHFVASVNGWYVFSANVDFPLCVSGKRLILGIHINGVLRALARLVTGSTEHHGVSVSLIYKMNEGDYAAVYVYHTFGVTRNLSPTIGYNQFSGALLGEF